jgi:hypothetical protein
VESREEKNKLAIVLVRTPLTTLVMGVLKGIELFSSRVEVMEVCHDTALHQTEVPVITMHITTTTHSTINRSASCVTNALFHDHSGASQ